MSKDLRTSVRLDTKQAVKSLDALEKKINRINELVNKTNNTNSNLNKTLSEQNQKAKELEQSANRHANAVDKVNRGYKQANAYVNALSSKVKSLITAYLGIMGAKAFVGTSDSITHSMNKLNTINEGDISATKADMDKMYTSSQKVRMSYTDMMANVSKSMALAGDSFGDNIDNAIRFQEIMAEAYVLGGASDAEKSSSMYQMIQALGSGVLQGDELRSVREGAPLAYKAIEEFAQGVTGSTESLKELASQGLVTSDMVVAAIMNAGDKFDEQFKDTYITFGQLWTNIKNVATKAFEPVFAVFRELLGSTEMQKFVDILTQGLLILSRVLTFVATAFSKFFKWFVNNWEWIRWIVLSLVLVLIFHLGILAAKAIWTGLQMFYGFLMAYRGAGMIVFAIGIVVAALVWMANTSMSASEFICYGLLMIAGVIALLALILNATWLLFVAAFVALIALLTISFMAFGDTICGIITVVGAFIYNVVVGLVNDILYLCMCFIEPFLGIIEWILNACNGGFTSFGGAVANLIGQIISWFLTLGKVVTTIIDAIFGSDWTGALSSLQNKVLAWGKKEDAITIDRNISVNSISNGKLPNSISYGDAWSTGKQIGSNAQTVLNGWGSWLKDGFASLGTGSLMDRFGGWTGEYGDINDVLTDPASTLNTTDVGNGLGGSDIGKDVGDISDNVDDIADSMALTQDDLEYLRKIAALEWKKEYTTANITVDMKNYNTVEGDGDLDGIVTKLVSKLYEELDEVANGVYV